MSELTHAYWGKFIQMLAYKAARAGRSVVKINPRGTSKGLSTDDPLRNCRPTGGSSIESKTAASKYREAGL